MHLHRDSYIESDIMKRPSVTKLITAQNRTKEDENSFRSNSDVIDYNQESNKLLEKCTNLRTNSPSPIRKHGSLLDLFNATNNDASR